MKSGVVDAIRAAGGEVFGMTSEPQSLATEASETWEIGFPCIGDPHHEIRDALQERGFLGVFANPDYGHLRRRPWASHPKGYFQPGVVALSRAGRVLYRWRCRPMHQNMSGAGQRPTPEYVWGEIESRLPAGIPDAELDESPEFARPDPSWPVFLTMMLAHGWFLRPKAFPLARPGDRPSADARRMKRRVAAFAAAWVVALAVLPTVWVALGLAAWVAIALPGVAALYRQFQHIPHAEPKIHGP